MTQITQALPAIGTPRRKRVVSAAFEYIVSQKLSVEFKRAILGGDNSNNGASKRPEFLRLYFAMKAQKFATSLESRKAADAQRQARTLAQKQRLAARVTRNAVPTELKTEQQRQSWIDARIQTAQARKMNARTNTRVTRLAAE